jgi:hypothetical protein
MKPHIDLTTSCKEYMGREIVGKLPFAIDVKGGEKE